MKLATVSCRETEFPISRDQLLNVNDIAASWCFGSRIHLPLKSKVEALKDYDCVFFTMSKQVRPYEKAWMELLCKFKSEWPQKKVILHQEGEVEFYLARPATSWNLQKGWINVLRDKVDLLLTHNARDSGAYRYFVGRGHVETWRTVQDVEKMSPYLREPEHKERTVGISTYDGRANGVLGVSVACNITENITQITRSLYEDDRQEFINENFAVNPWVTPQTGWYDWLSNLSNIYLYLHPMPAASAGRDTIACAALGIPVIGNKNLDAQTHLFPELAVEPYDSRKMEELVRELLYPRNVHERKVKSGETIDSDLYTSLYERTRNHALKNFKFYNIDYGVERAEKIMKRLGWK